VSPSHTNTHTHTLNTLIQGEAIAFNLREMFGLRVPIISVVIGEGGSGGALAIGCANRNLIMENSGVCGCVSVCVCVCMRVFALFM